MTSPLTVPIAEALAAEEMRGFGLDIAPEEWLREARAAADACIAVIAALPADYTAVDVLAHLRGEDVPSEPLPVKFDDGYMPAEASPCACGKPSWHVHADPDSPEWACRVPDGAA